MKPNSIGSVLAPCLLFLTSITTVAGPLAAQDLGQWNGARVLDLVDRARERRQSTVVDSTFQSYQAEARGYVYFFFDRPDTGSRSLVKADQIALDVYWKAPNATRQRIVGQRDEELLPTNIRYHIDHLTVVQDDFGDYIRMGDGDEVEAVLHPVGPNAEQAYDYLLADSLTIRYAAGAEEVRVYEVRVRPRDFDSPGFVGAIYLDRSNGAIVRMSFSFTPASYVDPYVDYIRISLDNSLWMGRHWLPYRQEVELRRETPMLDVMLGSVIRGRFEIRGYDFNVDLSDTLFEGNRITSLSPAQRAAFEFERGLFDDLDEEGLDPSPSLEEVRTQVRDVVEDRALSGLDPLRLYLPSLSEVARYNRAEGLRLGAGATLRPRGDLLVRGSGGYAFGRERFSGSISAIAPEGAVVPTLTAYWDDLADIGGNPGASTLVNTISAVSGEEDFTDPYFKRGASLSLRGTRADGLRATFRWEEHRSASDVVSDDPTDTSFRPVRSIDEGWLGALTVEAPFGLPGAGELRLTGEGGRLEDRSYGSLAGRMSWDLRRPQRHWHAQLSLEGGAVTDRAPAQSLYMLGGRWTLPGHDYRSFVGDRYWLLRTVGTIPIVTPYVGLRLIGAAGSTYLHDRSLPADWIVRDSNGVRGSIGAGLSIGWDSMRIDLAHGVRGGGWEALFSVAEQFQGWL